MSPEERKAGLPGHGEANRVPWEVVSSEKSNGTTTVAFSATLPIVQEVFRRTIRTVDGEQVVYIESELENLLGFDRPINWGEHATIGPPFLEPGKTIVEMSATRSMTRSHESQSEKQPHRLASFKAFAWPMAPRAETANRSTCGPPRSRRPIGDHTTSLMDPARRLVFVTAFHPDKRLLLGYVFRREEYPVDAVVGVLSGRRSPNARGLEFATQPFDLPRREVIQTNSLFDTPTYRWLPAKSTIGSAFLMFYTRTPVGFRKRGRRDARQWEADDRGSRIPRHRRARGVPFVVAMLTWGAAAWRRPFMYLSASRVAAIDGVNARDRVVLERRSAVLRHEITVVAKLLQGVDERGVVDQPSKRGRWILNDAALCGFAEVPGAVSVCTRCALHIARRLPERIRRSGARETGSHRDRASRSAGRSPASSRGRPRTRRDHGRVVLQSQRDAHVGRPAGNLADAVDGVVPLAQIRRVQPPVVIAALVRRIHGRSLLRR